MSLYSIAIGIPVRNEAEHLPELLHALARQRCAPPFVVCFFFDSCDDDSEGLVEAMRAALPFRIITDRACSGASPSAGVARRRAMELAVRSAPEGVLLSTDADGEPDDYWIASNLFGLRRADIVAGRIFRKPTRPSVLADRLESYLNRLHDVRRRLDPVDYEDQATHHWTSAASLAVMTRHYLDAGQFQPVAKGEDALFVDDATRRGLRVRRDSAVIVRTSPRRLGRIPGGYATNLAVLDALREPDVSHPSDEAWRYAAQARARHLHGTGHYRSFAEAIGLAACEVEQVAEECVNGEAFAARIVGSPPGGMRQVPLSLAEQVLTRMTIPTSGVA
ncbi:glycosyltransferase [Sphingomonas beigongshangi]|uniref:glycosyltransferase n=1 Tax=Sphingomonas beigongshangi TaxID=2782540 RepID=UPI001AEDBE7D|nr:glycosyltransferase family A protein [Sphingomonas beigongshangi]